MQFEFESNLKASQVPIVHAVSKNAPTLASCSFDKHALILIIFGQQHQHTFKNDVHVQLSLFLQFYLLYWLLNSCDGNNAFWRSFMLVKQYRSFSWKHRTFISLDLCLPHNPVDYRICGLTQELTCVHCTNTCPWYQPLSPATWSSASLTHGQAYHKTSSSKQVVNGESDYV